MTLPSQNPNQVSKSRVDAKSVVGVCPLMNLKVQLLPLRYGVVERLDPSAQMAMPFQLKSRPLGIRLMRDGWLYVVADKKPKPILHEYRVSKGVITQLLWNKSELAANKRESSVGEASLVFSRADKLYVGYSEVQWTAAKCRQVLQSSKERQYFMQAVDLLGVDCEKGGASLLTNQQAAAWLAEVAEQPSKVKPPVGALPEESKDYLWEQEALFRRTQFGELEKQLKPQYQHDHLYLVVRDDLGVLRDLAQHQELITGWIHNWSNDEEAQKRYIIGSYIQSLYTVTGDGILQAARQDPRFAALERDTDEVQRQSIGDYINTKHQTDWKGTGTHSGAIAAARMRMRQSLGESLYKKYADLIESLDDNTDDALDGAKLGQRGIDDLVDRPAMEAYVKRQAANLQRWNASLDLITDDRVALVTAERFHRAAWYFDPSYGNQMEAALATEYACLRDICRTDKASEAIAKLLDEQPGFSVPTFFTLSHADQVDVQGKLAGMVKAARDTLMRNKDYQGLNETAVKCNSLLSTQLPHAFEMSPDRITLDQVRGTAYEPARQLRLANAMDEAMRALQAGKPLDPAQVLRHLPRSSWLGLLRTVGQGGVTLEFASPNQVRTFSTDLDALLDLKRQRRELKKQIRQALGRERTGRAPKGSHRTLVAQRAALQQPLVALEARVALHYSPVGEGPGKVGMRVKGLNSAQVAEFQRMSEDFRLKRPFKGVGGEVFKSVGGDLFASAVAVMQVWSFVTVTSEFLRKTDTSSADKVALGNAFSSMVGGVSAALQGIAITSLGAALNNYTSVAGKVKSAASLGKLTGGLGIAAYFFSFVSNGISLYGAGGRWLEALRNGNTGQLASSSLQLAGDSGQIALNGWATVRTGGIIFQVLTDSTQARSLAWAASSARLLSIAARANLIGLGLTALQLGGEWLYNRNTLSELDRWLLHCAWGREHAGNSLRNERLRLALITGSPQARLAKLGGKPYAQLVIPSITARELDDSGLSLTAYWCTDAARNDWEPWTDPLLYQLSLLSSPDEPLSLGLELFALETNAQHGLALTLHAPLAPGETSRQEVHLEILTLNVQDGKPFNRVKLLRVRNPNAMPLPVTLDRLHLPDDTMLPG
ncbi:toxin VasX [Pseudomonas sp. MT3]